MIVALKKTMGIPDLRAEKKKCGLTQKTPLETQKRERPPRLPNGKCRKKKKLTFHSQRGSEDQANKSENTGPYLVEEDRAYRNEREPRKKKMTAPKLGRMRHWEKKSGDWEGGK